MQCSLLLAVLFATAISSISLLAAPPERPHVLFIAIDDLRPELGCYGSPVAKTPHLDALAADGLLFNRAYCQQAICSPSRASLMTGARPDTIGVVENTAYFRDLNPDIVTLPQHFIAKGYETAFAGKIYHSRKMTDMEKSWSRGPAWKKLSFKPTKLIGGYATEENQKIWQSERTGARPRLRKSRRARPRLPGRTCHRTGVGHLESPPRTAAGHAVVPRPRL